MREPITKGNGTGSAQGLPPKKTAKNVGTLQKVRDAEVSVGVGDVDAPPIGQLRGWLGHTWRYQGNGQYRLYAHTSFGDASLLAK